MKAIQTILFGSPGTGKSHRIDKTIIPTELKLNNHPLKTGGLESLGAESTDTRLSGLVSRSHEAKYVSLSRRLKKACSVP